MIYVSITHINQIIVFVLLFKKFSMQDKPKKEMPTF